jgi:hypothetical protein
LAALSLLNHNRRVPLDPSTLLAAYIVLVIFSLVLLVAWIVMPFAIIGTKPILRDIRSALEENNRLLREAREQRTPTTSTARASDVR